MGLSSLAVVMGIIGQVYAIDLKINNLVNRKLQYSRIGAVVGNNQVVAAGANKGDLVPFRFVDIKKHEVADCMLVNQPDPATGQNRVIACKWAQDPNNPGQKILVPDLDYGANGDVTGNPVFGNIQQVVTANNRAMSPGWEAPKSDQQPLLANGSIAPDYQRIDPGTARITKEQAEAMSASYMREIGQREKEIDQELEELRAKRTALNTQREEFTKYTSEGIKFAFKNNYA